MKINNPIPQSLPKECAKAARIFRSFVTSKNSGLDGIIPRNILQNAKGFAIFTVFKAGFVFSARAGSGIVIAKLSDGSWSAPSAIGTAGLGFGSQAGAEMTDFLIVLNSPSAIRSFMSAGSLTLGGNLSIALGPLGRNGEAMGSMNTNGKMAAMYSYSKTRGLFGGISLEGSVIVARSDANASAYNSSVAVKSLLSGVVSQPDWAAPLYQALQESILPRGGPGWVIDSEQQDTGYAFEGVQGTSEDGSSRLTYDDPSRLSRNPTSSNSSTHAPPSFPPPTWVQSGSDLNNPARSTSSSSGRLSSQPRQSWEELARQDTKSATSNFETQFESDFQDELTPSRSHRRNESSPISPSDPFAPPPYSELSHGRTNSMANSFSNSNRVNSTLSHNTSVNNGFPADVKERPVLSPREELRSPISENRGIGRAIALFDFEAVEPGDLSFSKGQVIIITEKSTNTDTWWKGEVDGRKGAFPANFVEVV